MKTHQHLANISLLVATLVVAEASGACAEGIEAGLWRSIQTPTINGTTGPPRETSRCLREADVADLKRTFSPVYGTTNSACEQVEDEFTQQRLKWRLDRKSTRLNSSHLGISY